VTGLEKLRRGCVLIVDGEVSAQAAIAESLAALGFADMMAAADATAAAAILDANAPAIDAILCDLHLQGTDSAAFLRHLAERGYRGGVVLAGAGDPRMLKTAEALARAHALNILGSVTKPASTADFAAVLKRYTGQNGHRSPAPEPDRVDADELRRAIAHGELDIAFQPKVSLPDGRLAGVETLVRWNRPGIGMVPTDSVVAAAEESGAIDEMTDAVLGMALRQDAIWRAAGTPVRIAVNISVACLRRLDLPERLAAAAAKEGASPADILLELTESRITRDITGPLEVLTRLRLMGAGLAIDDFGIGYSSLAQLGRMPFTEMKIDRAFVSGAARDPELLAILESSVALGRKLELTVVAEGVETRDDWDLVTRLGCHQAQGYFVAGPLPGDAIVPWARGWRAPS
jgi:EAL domain-containing protein (putative c-di-GMP-specific phosphodiesterase class I)/FixJ family two-component response regulator